MTPRAADRVLILRVTLAETDPPVWRRIAVTADTTLHRLHRVIQLIMRWYDYHLYEFRIGAGRYEAPGREADYEDASRTSLTRFRLRPGDAFTYHYDFGDGWRHEIVVEAQHSREDYDLLPLVLEGAGAGPPEDCGGSGGFRELTAALADPSHPDHESTRDWVGPDYDPHRFSPSDASHALILCKAWRAL